jgi:ureidoglycolate dehydrogenase (NAD+)
MNESKKINKNLFVQSDQIYTLIKEIFANLSVDKKIAELCAEGLVQTSLRGIDTHGIKLLPHYVAAIESGRLNPNPKLKFKQTSSTTGILDADHTLGYAAGVIAIKHAIELAKESGSGFVSVKNSSHCGALAYPCLKACDEGMIGLGFTHATSRMKSPGAKREFFGTNPLCFTAPMEKEDPFCFDSSPTMIPFHKIFHYRETKSILPENAAADKYGIQTLDPFDAVQLLPIGDYKGFGWSMMVDILAGLLSGMPVARDITPMYGDITQKRYLGHFFGCIRVDVFQPVEKFKSRLQELAERVRKEPKKDSTSVNMIPGDPEKKCMEMRLENGIPISNEDLTKLNKLFKKILDYEL